MPLLELVSIEVGGAIAKSILKLWAKDSDLWSNVSDSLTDVLKSITSDTLAQRKANRQFEEIGETVGKSLLPLFESEGTGLDEGGRKAVAYAVAKAFNGSTLSAEILATKNLDPTLLYREILAQFPASSHFFGEAEASFYERIIEEACRSVVNIASSLPAFSERMFAEILERTEDLLTITKQIVAEQERIREQLNPAIEDERFEIEYREAVARNLDVLHLIGADVSLPNRRHRLSVAYITLSVERQIMTSDAQRKSYTSESAEADEEAITEIVPVNQALIGARRMLIRGAAGSGKTTLLQWIAVRAATRTFDEPLKDWNDKLPFYIRLRQYTQNDPPGPEDFLHYTARSIEDIMPNGWVHRKLESGQAIVLIDGVDEVPQTRREEVHSWLHDLIDTFPKALFLVTSRPHAIPEGWMNHAAFHSTDLQDMASNDIFAFIDHWHEAVFAEVNTEEEKRELEPLAEHLKQEIVAQRPLRILARNPLLCAMLCALHRERRRHLPVNRIELYRACCELLLERREKESHIDLSEYPALHLGQKERLLQDLAYWMMQEGLAEAATDQVDTRFLSKLAHMPGLSEEITGKKVRQLLVERTGIIREIVDGQIDFTHRTFEEFYAACEILSRGEIDSLLGKAHDQQWREVIILATGLAPKHICEQLITGLIQRGDAEQANRHTLYLLAVACLETAIELDKTIKNTVEQRLSQIIPPKNMTEAKTIAAAGELAVKYLGSQQKRSATTSAACVRTLALIGGEMALTMLEAYTHDWRETVRSELWKGWDLCEREEMYARRVIARMMRDATSWHMQNIMSLAGFQYFPNLTSLHLSECRQLIDLAPLASLTNLTSLHLSKCRQLVDLAPLASLTNLTSLELSYCGQLVDLAPLAALSNLTSLNLPYCGQLVDLAPLAALSNLTSLRLSWCEQLVDLAPLAALSNLTSLDLSGCRQLVDLAPLAALSNLTSLNLSGCRQLLDLAPLEALTNLTDLRRP